MSEPFYRKHKWILLAAICFGMMAAGLSVLGDAVFVYAYTPTAGTVNDGPVRVRSAPVDGEKVTLLYPGTAVTVIEETVGSDGYTWYQIQVSGMTGYIRSCRTPESDTRYTRPIRQSPRSPSPQFPDRAT